MVAIVTIVMLAALIIPKLQGSQCKACISPAQSDETSFDTALKSFHLDCNRYPTMAEGLAALRRPPTSVKNLWHGPYLDEDAPNDPWGNPYIYTQPGPSGKSDSYSLTSYGSDGQPGGTGEATDIVDNNG